MISAGIIAVCWIVFLSYWAFSARTVKRDVYRTPTWQRFVGLAIYLAAFAASETFASQWRIIPQGTITGSIAASFCLSGIALAIWARRHLASNWSIQPALKEGHELVTSGPYRMLRHPIYTGILIAMLGSAVLYDGVWLIAFALLCVLFTIRAHQEEQLMQGQFPNLYPEYCRRTKMLIPFVW